jgi:DNA-binding HxlR family transcriptional regulator
MKRDTFAEAPCSLTRTLDVIGDPWTPLVLRDIAFGVSRFDTIQANLGLSRKVLAQRLQSLADHGVIDRVPYQHNPPRHDYTLTKKGRDLAMVLVAIQAFGDKWEAGAEGPPVRWLHTTCGEVTTAVLCCDRCGERLRPDDGIPLRGPGFADDAFPEITKVIDYFASRS